MSPTPVTEPSDDGRIPIAWRLARSGAPTLAHAAGVLLVDDGSEVAIVDAASGTIRSRSAPPPRENGFDDQPRAALLASGAIVTEPQPGVLSVLDASGAERWRTACRGPSYPTCRVRVVEAAGAIVMATGSTLGLVALDAQGGASRWSYEPDTGLAWDASALASDGERVLIGTYGTHRLLALDGATGALAWEAECDPAFEAGAGAHRGPGQCLLITAAAGRVATISVSGSEVLVLDAATGALLYRLTGTALGMGVLRAELTADTLWLGGLASEEAGAVTAIDLASGATRWTVRLPEPVRRLAPEGDVVWARGMLGTLWRLRASDGVVLSRWGFASGRELLALDGALILDDGTDVVRVTPDRAPDPDPELVVRGNATLESEYGTRVAGLRVRVGDEVVTTAEDGAFEARLRARGGVRAWIEGDPASPCDEVERPFVPQGASEPVRLRRISRECRGE